MLLYDYQLRWRGWTEDLLKHLGEPLVTQPDRRNPDQQVRAWSDSHVTGTITQRGLDTRLRSNRRDNHISHCRDCAAEIMNWKFYFPDLTLEDLADQADEFWNDRYDRLATEDYQQLVFLRETSEQDFHRRAPTYLTNMALKNAYVRGVLRRQIAESVSESWPHLSACCRRSLDQIDRTHPLTPEDSLQPDHLAHA